MSQAIRGFREKHRRALVQVAHAAAAKYQVLASKALHADIYLPLNAPFLEILVLFRTRHELGPNSNVLEDNGASNNHSSVQVSNVEDLYWS